MADSGAIDWAQLSGWIGGGLGATLLTLWQARKTKAEPVKGEATVLTAAFADSRTFAALAESNLNVVKAIEGLSEQHHDDTRALRAVLEDVAIELRRNTAAASQGAVTPRELMALLAQLKT